MWRPFLRSSVHDSQEKEHNILQTKQDKLLIRNRSKCWSTFVVLIIASAEIESRFIYINVNQTKEYQGFDYRLEKTMILPPELFYYAIEWKLAIIKKTYMYISFNLVSR